MPTNSKAGSNSKAMLWVGWGMSGLTVLFMLFDGLSKLVLERHVVEATTKIGYPVDVIQPLGIILLISDILTSPGIKSNQLGGKLVGGW
jgi:hypothetical protein